MAGGHLGPGVLSVNEALTLAVNLLSNLKAPSGSAVCGKGLTAELPWESPEALSGGPSSVGVGEARPEDG